MVELRSRVHKQSRIKRREAQQHRVSQQHPHRRRQPLVELEPRLQITSDAVENEEHQRRKGARTERHDGDVHMQKSTDEEGSHGSAGRGEAGLLLERCEHGLVQQGRYQAVVSAAPELSEGGRRDGPVVEWQHFVAVQAEQRYQCHLHVLDERHREEIDGPDQHELQGQPVVAAKSIAASFNAFQTPHKPFLRHSCNRLFRQRPDSERRSVQQPGRPRSCKVITAFSRFAPTDWQEEPEKAQRVVSQLQVTSSFMWQHHLVDQPNR
mmetsp:Transcript_33294/g.96144  ORF Transcript_33294/g.96144 Transcript_33294/m.96144 type:complete len:266 (-) Transcript_33294:340-1137(-)